MKLRTTSCRQLKSVCVSNHALVARSKTTIPSVSHSHRKRAGNFMNGQAPILRFRRALRCSARRCHGSAHSHLHASSSSSIVRTLRQVPLSRAAPNPEKARNGKNLREVHVCGSRPPNPRELLPAKLSIVLEAIAHISAEYPGVGLPQPV